MRQRTRAFVAGTIHVGHDERAADGATRQGSFGAAEHKCWHREPNSDVVARGFGEALARSALSRTFIVLDNAHLDNAPRGARKIPRHAFPLFVMEVGKARSVAAVGPILDILPHQSAFERTVHASTRSTLIDALVRLLPRMTTDDARALTPKQRATLREFVAVIPDAVWIARHRKSERLRDATMECARALGAADRLENP